MKVRLKPMQRVESHSRTLFQFHEGPIKTYYVFLLAVRGCRFQFHEGPIKTGASPSIRHCLRLVSIP